MSGNLTAALAADTVQQRTRAQFCASMVYHMHNAHEHYKAGWREYWLALFTFDFFTWEVSDGKQKMQEGLEWMQNIRDAYYDATCDMGWF